MNDEQQSTESPSPSAEILDLFRERGGSQYGREAVTQLEHALQSAYFAERAGAVPSLIVAALLHDVGHLLHELPDDAPEHGVDDRHEALAGRWLAERFEPAVVEPVRMHVDAKRYLCATHPEYARLLSPPSARSLALQGGPMNVDEAQNFESHPFHAAAVQLRRWDDQAKVVGLATPGLDHFVQYVDLL